MSTSSEQFLPLKVFDLVYGPPAAGKSEYAARVVEQMHVESGKKIRIVCGDGSLQTYQHLIDSGIAEFVEFAHRSWPTDTLNRLTSGWWPQDFKDPTSPLIAPSKQIMDVGGYVFEGVSTAASYIMSNVEGGLAWRAGRGEKMGQDTPIKVFEGELDNKGVLIPGSGPGTSFGGNPPSHYNYTQRNMTGFIQQSRGLPSQVIVWTAHESMNDPEKDSLVKEQIAGPEVVGKALTSNLQRILNNTLHATAVQKRSKVDDKFTNKKVDELDVEYRLYTRDHFNANGAVMVRYKACTRGVDADFPQYFQSDEPGKAMIDFYRELAKMREQKSNNLTTRRTS